MIGNHCALYSEKKACLWWFFKDLSIGFCFNGRYVITGLSMSEICEALFWIFLYGYRRLADDRIVSIIDLTLAVNPHNHVHVEKETTSRFCLVRRCSRTVLLETVPVPWSSDKIRTLKKWTRKLQRVLNENWQFHTTARFNSTHGLYLGDVHDNEIMSNGTDVILGWI